MADELRTFGIGLETAGVACMWLAVALRAPTVIRSHEQRPLWLAVLGAATAVTLHLQWVNDLVFLVTGPTHLTALARNLFGVLTSAAVLDFVFLAVRGRHTYALYRLAIVVMAVLIFLDMTAESHLPHAVHPVAGPSPSTAYWAVLISVNLGTNIVCATACWWYSRASRDAALRVGLRLFGLSAVFSGTYWLLSVAYIEGRYFWIPSVTPLLLGCYAFVRASAICVPIGIATVLALRRLRILYRLWPLWRDLVDAVPGIHLEIRKRGVIFPRWPGSLDLLLYRTVIEIRDAILHLRAYVPEADLDAIRDAIEHGGSPRTETDPLVTACWLRIARQAKENGVSPLRGDLTAPVLGGTDLPGEIEFLCKVAQADALSRLRRIPVTSTIR
ncbi:MAB_1171c family putative transporter [Streptomyces abikoensis]|uniref:MAB_1171c family putative transporter n=1 Tax=Streptomyces abikoensis TaxID=97398 RepID=A0ABW7SX74_9ACTN